MRSFELDDEMIPYLRQINDVPSRAEFEYRPDRPHATLDGKAWAMVFSEGYGRDGLTLAVAHDEDELRQGLDRQLIALREKDDLEEMGVSSLRYRELITECTRVAERLGIDITDVPGVEFVRDWSAYSDGMAATWMMEDDASVEECVMRVAKSHDLVASAPGP